MLIRRVQPDDATRVIHTSTGRPSSNWTTFSTRRLIIEAVEDVRRLPHMIVFIVYRGRKIN